MVRLERKAFHLKHLLSEFAFEPRAERQQSLTLNKRLVLSLKVNGLQVR